MSVHRFSTVQRSLRDGWFERVETPDDWTELGPVGEGESQSLRVLNSADRMMGVAKPGPPKAAEDHHCRAANERLAFDLSCLVPLPVSPTILWPIGAGAPYKRGRAISCWAFPQAMKWSEADGKGLLSPVAKLSAGNIVSAMRVFHTWIGETDRKGDHVIVNLDSPDGQIELAFIDHGNALSYAWPGPDAPINPIGRYLDGVPEVVDEMIDAADYISRVDDAEITRVVDRIPPIYLPSPKRENIIQNLKARKSKLRAALGI